MFNLLLNTAWYKKLSIFAIKYKYKIYKLGVSVIILYEIWKWGALAQPLCRPNS